MAGPTGNPLSTPPADSAAVVNESGQATTQMKQWMRGVKRVLQPGISITVALAPTTSGGTAGSITVVNGIVTGYTAPT
jgi:hypothetical protein